MAKEEDFNGDEAGTSAATGPESEMDFSDEELRQELQEQCRERRLQRQASKTIKGLKSAEEPPVNGHQSVAAPHGLESQPTPVMHCQAKHSEVIGGNLRMESSIEVMDAASSGPIEAAVNNAFCTPDLQYRRFESAASVASQLGNGTFFTDKGTVDQLSAAASIMDQYRAGPSPFACPTVTVPGERQGRAASLPGFLQISSPRSGAGHFTPSQFTPRRATQRVVSVSLDALLVSPNPLQEPDEENLMHMAAEMMTPMWKNTPKQPQKEGNVALWPVPAEDMNSAFSGSQSSSSSTPKKPRRSSCHHPLHRVSPPPMKTRPLSPNRQPFKVSTAPRASSAPRSRDIHDLDDSRFFLSAPDRPRSSSPPRPLYVFHRHLYSANSIPCTPPKDPRVVRQSPSPPTSCSNSMLLNMDYLSKARHNVLKAVYEPTVMEVIMRCSHLDPEGVTCVF